MDIRYKLSPFPVLAYYSDDYVDGEFSVEISVKNEGYNVRADFKISLTSPEIWDLIHKDKARIAYHFECHQTAFRQVILVKDSASSVILPERDLNGQLQICPFVVAQEDIDDYCSAGFHDDYAGMTFSIDAGCVLAIGKQVNVLIEKEKDDLANTPSVFSIIRNADPQVSQMIVGIDSQKIIVKLPMDDYYTYKQLNVSPLTQPILNSMTIIPALTYVLDELKMRSVEEREELVDYGWYRVVRKALKSKFNCDVETDAFNLQHTVVLAQKLINDPLSQAFKVLAEGYNAAPGDIE